MKQESRQKQDAFLMPSLRVLITNTFVCVGGTQIRHTHGCLINPSLAVMNDLSWYSDAASGILLAVEWGKMTYHHPTPPDNQWGILLPRKQMFVLRLGLFRSTEGEKNVSLCVQLSAFGSVFTCVTMSTPTLTGMPYYPTLSSTPHFKHVHKCIHQIPNTIHFLDHLSHFSTSPVLLRASYFWKPSEYQNIHHTVTDLIIRSGLKP